MDQGDQLSSVYAQLIHLSLLIALDRFSIKGYMISSIFIILFCFRRNNDLSGTSSVDSDQTPRFAVSDLGLHCLPKSLQGIKGLRRHNISPHSIYYSATSK